LSLTVYAFTRVYIVVSESHATGNSQAEAENIFWNTVASQGHSASWILRSLYNNVGFISKGSEDMATEITKNQGDDPFRICGKTSQILRAKSFP